MKRNVLKDAAGSALSPVGRKSVKIDARNSTLKEQEADYEILEERGLDFEQLRLLCDILSHYVKVDQAERCVDALYSRYGRVAEIYSAPEAELLLVSHVTPELAKAVARVGLSIRRMCVVDILRLPILKSLGEVEKYLRAAMSRERVEKLRVLFLDSGSRLVGDEELWTGTINHVPMYPREIVKRGLELYATQIIVAHNHPSGDPQPSEDDIASTNQLAVASRLLEIQLLDHIIVGREGVFSFRREKLIET